MSTTLELRVGALVTSIGAALEAALDVAAEEAQIPKPCLVGILPGSVVAFDYCEQGGMAWARLVDIVPVETIQGNRCLIEYDVTVEVAILRCAPGMTEAGDLPTEGEQLAAAMLSFFDMGLMHKVITCTPVPEAFSFASMGPFTPIGPEGNCLGGTWTRTWRIA